MNVLDESDWSVCYRTGLLTAADYDEAIAALQDAKRALTESESRGCMICTDGGCSAHLCRHNPIVLARAYAAATSIWVCYHCGTVCRTDAEAVEHFGRSEDEIARCLRPSPSDQESAP